MATQLIFATLLMAAVFGYTFYMRRKVTAGMPDAFRMFFERTGYRYADIQEQPLEAHIMHGATLTSNPNGHDVHMVRDFHGIAVHSEQSYKATREGRKTTISRGASWWVPLQAPPRVHLQIAERTLTGTVKAIKEAFGNSERLWSQRYPVGVASGDPELDKRMLFFGTDPAAVQRVLATPGLRELLLGSAEVDLSIYEDRVVFSDPLQRNMMAGMGGTVGSMAMGADIMKRMELTIPVHDRMAQLLALVARAVQ